MSMKPIHPQVFPSGSGGPHSSRPLILVVEDATELRTLLHLGLWHEGFDVLVASNGSEAFDLYQEHRHSIAGVLLDVEMPGWDGPKTFRALQALDPNVRCCFMSGNPNGSLLEELTALETPFLWKPFHLKDLADKLRRLVATSGRPY
jgi:CheY-like chemotaxis protein